MKNTFGLNCLGTASLRMRPLIFSILVGGGAAFSACQSGSRESGEGHLFVRKETVHTYDEFLRSDAMQNASPEAKAIVAAIVDSTLRVSVEGIPQTASDPTKERQCEIVTVPVATSRPDALHHAILIDHQAKLFWIRRSGGGAGITSFHGPLKIEGDGSGGFAIRPAANP